MTNHVHLLVTPRRPEAISLVMRDVGRRYVQYINYSYRRSGTLWEGRFKSILVDAQRYFFTCCRYIELNPVRAGIVTRPEEYRWSSHCHYALGREDHLVTAHEEYQALGNDETARRQAYRELFSGHLDEKVLTEIRGAVDRGSFIDVAMPGLYPERALDSLDESLTSQNAPRRPLRWLYSCAVRAATSRMLWAMIPSPVSRTRRWTSLDVDT
jgi:hypothetical protein